MEGLTILAVAAVLYFLPSIVANIRHVTTEGTVIVINIFLGWTVIGWVVAFAMAFGPTRPVSSAVAYTTDVHKWDPPNESSSAREAQRTSLTPEERQRIYEEEKMRLEIREQLKQEQAAKEHQSRSDGT